MTGTLNIRYLAATPLNTPVDFEARLVSLERRKLCCEGSVWVNGEQTVSAEGIWISAHGEYALKPEFSPAPSRMPRCRRNSSASRRRMTEANEQHYKLCFTCP